MEHIKKELIKAKALIIVDQQMTVDSYYSYYGTSETV